MDNSKPMTLSEATKLFLNGGRLLVGEYRSSKAETINWRNTETGKPMSAGTLSHIVEVGRDSVIVKDYLPDGLKPEDYQSGIPKGSPVIIEVKSITVDKGLVSCRGTLRKFDPKG